MVKLIFLSSAFLTLILMTACSGGKGGENPVEPAMTGFVDSRTSEAAEPGHYLWSYNRIYLDAENNVAQIIPLRQVADHWNVLRWLEQGPCTTCLKISRLTQEPDGTLIADVTCIHPFTGANLTGFDVRGIAIFDASRNYPESLLTLSDRTLGDNELLNPEGYTTLYNAPTEGRGPGGLQGYIPGRFAAPQPPDGRLNGYRRFITSDPSNTRNAFYAGGTVTTTYEIHKTPGPIEIGYAVDASWSKADVIPVNDPMTDFPIEANCPEPWRIDATADPIPGDGATDLTIDVYDWQGVDTHSAPVVECPELFDGTLTASLVSVSTGYSRWQVSVQNTNSAAQGSYRCLIGVEANENDPINKPWLDLTAYQIVDIAVLELEEGWARTWGDVGNDLGLDVAVDSGGDVLISGLFEGSVDFDPGPSSQIRSSSGRKDAFLSRFDSAGNLIWVRTWGGSDDDTGYGLDTDSQGNAYVAGYFNGTIDFDPDPAEEENRDSGAGSGSFVSKFDAQGDFIWVHTWDVYGPSEARDLDVGPDDQVYLVGYERIDTGQFACYFRKISDAGNMEYHQLFAGIDYYVPFDDEFSIIADNFSNVYITGLFDGVKDFDPGPDIENHTSLGSYDAFLSKFSTDGTYRWSRLWGSDYFLYECGSGVGTDSLGNVYVAGYWGGDTDFDPGSGIDLHTADGWDAYLSKFDPDGNFLWVKVWGQDDAFDGDWGYGEGANDLTVGPFDNIYVTGNFALLTDFDPGPGTFMLSPTGNIDAFLSKFSADGDFLWARNWGGDEQCCQDDGELYWESGLGVAPSPSGSIYATGMYSSENSDDVNLAPTDPPCNEADDYHTPSDKYECFLIKFRSDGCW